MLRLEGLRVAYGGRTALEGLDVPALAGGRLVALLGPNGAGKSSALRAIAGLQSAQGRAWLDGQELGALAPAQRAAVVAYLPQALPQASTLTVYESVLGAVRNARPQWSRAEAHDRIAAVLERLDLLPLAMRPLQALSGGQRQMAGLAQLLARAPRVLLLDEPTSALDLRWQLRLLTLLQAQVAATGAVCVIALHDLNLAARFCAQALVLARGRLLALGAPSQVLDAQLLRRAWGIAARVEPGPLGTPMVLAEHALDGDFEKE